MFNYIHADIQGDTASDILMDPDYRTTNTFIRVNEYRGNVYVHYI